VEVGFGWDPEFCCQELGGHDTPPNGDSAYSARSVNPFEG
jgi:hypothetical protein